MEGYIRLVLCGWEINLNSGCRLILLRSFSAHINALHFLDWVNYSWCQVFFIICFYLICAKVLSLLSWAWFILGYDDSIPSNRLHMCFKHLVSLSISLYNLFLLFLKFGFHDIIQSISLRSLYACMYLRGHPRINFFIYNFLDNLFLFHYFCALIFCSICFRVFDWCFGLI